jgi:hypothetical protein
VQGPDGIVDAAGKAEEELEAMLSIMQQSSVDHGWISDKMQLLDVFSIYKSNNEFYEWLIILFHIAV